MHNLYLLPITYTTRGRRWAKRSGYSQAIQVVLFLGIVRVKSEVSGKCVEILTKAIDTSTSNGWLSRQLRARIHRAVSAEVHPPPTVVPERGVASPYSCGSDAGRVTAIAFADARRSHCQMVPVQREQSRARPTPTHRR